MNLEYRDELQKICCKLEFLKEAAEILKEKDDYVLSGFYFFFQDLISHINTLLNKESDT